MMPENLVQKGDSAPERSGTAAKVADVAGARRGGRKILVASTGAANLASVMAALGRVLAGTGSDAQISEDAADIAKADYAILPGVGAFGPAMEKLVASGIADAFRERFAAGRPSMGICLGMQLFCASSEESGGVEGMGIVQATVRRFVCNLPLPQLGWNRVAAGSYPDRPGERGLVADGWAYYANSYCVAEGPAGFRVSRSVYGEPFVASLEYSEPGRGMSPSLLLCQFHPELSGPWGQSLYRRWLGVGADEGEDTRARVVAGSGLPGATGGEV